MPKREMNEFEYENQQFYYRFSILDPIELQKKFDNKFFTDPIEEEERKEKIDELKLKLTSIIMKKIETCLTKRQKEIIDLYLAKKKQEHMSSILGISQPAAQSRLSIAFKRLKKSCDKDKEIQDILKELKEI